MKKFRLAVATNGKEGLEDAVSQVFGRANTFTIVDVENMEIQRVKVQENSAVSYKHGAGPIAVSRLVDSRVNIVIAAEFGPGALALLEQHNITMTSAKPGTKVKSSIEDTLRKLQSG